MAAVSKESNVSQVGFRLKVSEVSKLNKIWSPSFLIQGVPWKVDVTKTTIETDHFLSVQLICENKKMSSQSSYAAVASFKVLPFNGNVSVIKYLEPYVFDSTGLISNSASIRWIELFDVEKNFVKNDTAFLDIQIDVTDPNDKNKSKLKFESIDSCCQEGRVGTFQLTIDNIDNLIAVRSPEFKLRNVPWFLTVFKHSEHLGIRLDSRISPNDIICNIGASVKFIAINGNTQTIQRTKKVAQKFRRKEGFVMERLITWDDLINPQHGFIKNGTEITLEIEINAEKPEASIQNSRKRPSITATSKSKSSRLECTICNAQIETQDVSSTHCGHLFCTACIVNYIRERKACPTCNSKTYLKFLRPLLLTM